MAFVKEGALFLPVIWMVAVFASAATFAMVGADTVAARSSHHARHNNKDKIDPQPQQQQQPQPQQQKRLGSIFSRTKTFRNRKGNGENKHPQQNEAAANNNLATTTTTAATTRMTDDGEDDSSIVAAKPSPQQQAETGVYTDKPVLRGQFHKWGAILYPPLLGLPLYLKGADNPTTLRSALLFSFAVELILVISGTLHTFPWKTEEGHNIARKLDFAAIFVGIACFYSSMGKLIMGHHSLWPTIEGLVWVCAVLGTLVKWRFPEAPKLVNGSIFLVQGWASLPLVPAMFSESSARVARGMFSGGVFVSLGALAYICQWPKNIHNKAQFEIVFGPHEMFHVGTLFMIASFWFTIWTRVDELGTIAVLEAAAAAVAGGE